MKKAIILEEDSRYDLECELNKLLNKGYEISKISYSIVKHGYQPYHTCVVIVDDNK